MVTCKDDDFVSRHGKDFVEMYMYLVTVKEVRSRWRCEFASLIRCINTWRGALRHRALYSASRLWLESHRKGGFQSLRTTYITIGPCASMQENLIQKDQCPRM